MSLAVISSKQLPHGLASDNNLVAYCDPHDLIAIATDTQDVVVYRLSGQVVFTLKAKVAEARVTALGWKRDGSVLGVGWGNGSHGFYEGGSGRVVGVGSVRCVVGVGERGDGGDEVEGGAGTVVRGFRWMRYRAEGIGRLAGVGEVGDDGFDEDSDGEIGVLSNGKLHADGKSSIDRLARSIATMDVTTVLPRLSAIPFHGHRSGPDRARLVSQAAIDTVLETTKDGAAENLDTLVICSSDGSARVLVDDTVKIGTCKLPGVPLFQASHPSTAAHAVLSQTKNQELYLNTIDLPLDTLGGPLLHVIATNTKRLQSLLLYTFHTLLCIAHDYTTGLSFPSRLLTNMQTELSEKEEGDLATNLYHLAMTGHFTDTMTEWLVDVVKETNHKRWDQAVNGIYTNIQQHLFVNLKPALDRLSIATTTLRGYASYHENSTTFEVPPALFTKMLDGIDSLRLVSQKILLVVMAEQKQFRAFSKWLRVMIEIGVAGPGSKGAVETEERENPNLEYPLLLEYIERTLMRSAAGRFVEQRLQGTPRKQSTEQVFGVGEMAEMSFARTCEALGQLDGLGVGEELRVREVRDAEGLVNLPTLAAYLDGHARVAVERIAEWPGKMLRAPQSVVVQAERGCRVLDMQTDVQTDGRGKGGGSEQAITRLLLLPPETRERLLIYSFTHPITTSSGTQEPTIHECGAGILDAKFHAPNSALVLHRARDNDDQDRPRYLISVISVPSHEHANPEHADLHPPILHEVRDQGVFTPEKLVIGGRKGKRVCLVFGNGGGEWRALDLDSNSDGGQAVFRGDVEGFGGAGWESKGEEENSDEEMIG